MHLIFITEKSTIETSTKKTEENVTEKVLMTEENATEKLRVMELVAELPQKQMSQTKN